MKFALILTVIVLPLCGNAQDFSITMIDSNGKELPDTLGLIPSTTKVRVVSDEGPKRFRFRRVEAILARKNARVGTIDSRSPNLDLRVFLDQSNSGDYLVVKVYVEEFEGEKSITEHTKTRNYILAGKK